MSRNAVVDADLSAYVRGLASRPTEVQRALITATTEATGSAAVMQIGVDQGAFMSILTSLLRPAFAVEVGTFTGYSALAIASALPDGGRLLCCDVSEEWTAIARTHWDMAGVSGRIDLRIAPALDTLRALPSEQAIDLAFIDADKTGYLAYYNELLTRLSPSGVILVDNTLWSGRVLDPEADDADTVALREFNEFVAGDPRCESVILTIGDGVTMIRRRESTAPAQAAGTR